MLLINRITRGLNIYIYICVCMRSKIKDIWGLFAIYDDIFYYDNLLYIYIMASLLMVMVYMHEK